MNWKILAIRDVPAGFDNKVVGLVTFSYEPDELAGPLVITRWSKKAEKEFECAKIVGAKLVMVNDAQLCEGQGGKFYLLTNPIAVPDEVRFAVAAEGKKRWLEMSGEQKPAAESHKADAPSGGWGQQGSLRPAPTGTIGQ